MARWVVTVSGKPAEPASTALAERGAEVVWRYARTGGGRTTRLFTVEVDAASAALARDEISVALAGTSHEIVDIDRAGE